MNSTELTRTETLNTETTPVVTQWVVPGVDVAEREGDLRLSLDVPGVKADGLRVEVKQGVLEIDAQRADRPARGYRRRFRLPETVDAQRIEARLTNGVLTVVLPAAEAAKPRTIPVSVD